MPWLWPRAAGIQEVSLMLPPPRRRHKAACPRWRTPPWDTDHPRWQVLDRDLPADHLARRIERPVAPLDLRLLQASYAGLGSPAWPPALLLQLALYEVHTGRPSPAPWARDLHESSPVQWLVRGARPARRCLYAF